MNKHSPAEQWFLMETISANYLKNCSKKNVLHEKLSLIERSLCGINSTEAPVSCFDYERIEKNLFLKRSMLLNLSKEKIFTALTLATAACAIIISVFSLSKSISLSNEFSQKGGTNTNNFPRLYAFCISSDLRETRPITDKSVTCSLNSELQFALSNSENSEFEYLFIIGVDSAGRRMYYYPEYGDHKSVRIGKKIDKTPFKTSIKLAANHQKGNVAISAVFSKQQFTYDEIKQLFSQKPDGKSMKNFYIQSFSFIIE